MGSVEGTSIEVIASTLQGWYSESNIVCCGELVTCLQIHRHFSLLFFFVTLGSEEVGLDGLSEKISLNEASGRIGGGHLVVRFGPSI